MIVVTPQNEIVVTGQRYKDIVTIPNTDGSFSCQITSGSPHISVSITPFTVAVSRVDGSHRGWPLQGGREMTFFLNPDTATSTRFGGLLLAGRENRFDLTSRIRSGGSDSYSHNVVSRQVEQDVEMRFNVTISAPGGGTGTCQS